MKLSSRDAELWMTALAAWPRAENELLDWVTGPIREFFPFERVLLVHGEHVAGRIQTRHLLAHGHEEPYLLHIQTSFDLRLRGSLSRWFETRLPFGIDPDEPPAFATPLELEEIRTFGLGRVAAHGVVSANSVNGTYFSFSGIPTPLTEWHMNALTIMAPALNERYLHYLSRNEATPKLSLEALTPRQRTIVNRVASGWNNKQVARELGISHKTVRNQLTDIYTRAGVAGRAQLIARLRS